VTCSLCLQGYAVTPAGCVPCAEGCLVCNPADLITCTKCRGGWSLDSSNVCVNEVTCPMYCESCIVGTGCTACATGYTLNQNFLCQLQCVNPCKTCSVSNPLVCESCNLGYTLSGNTCVADLSCNTNGNCLTCPMGNILVENNSTAIRLNQTCSACDSASNCWRCMASNSAMCISCPLGRYLRTTDNLCISCASNCVACVNLNLCLFCANGFVDTQVGTI